MRMSRRAGLLVGVIALVSVACAESTATETTSAPPTTAAPATTSGDAPADGFPTRIVSLSPTHTEMLFAIGAGDQVIAVDAYSNYPADVEQVTDLSAWDPNVEAIAGYEPDLVVTEGTNPSLLEQLDALDIPHWSGPAVDDFEGIYAQLLELGEITGQLDNARFVVTEMRAEIEKIRASVVMPDQPLTYYHELDPSFFSVTSDTFIGFVYAQLGMTSIADAAEGSGGQYPQLNAEFILDADPDLILLACTKYCGETAESVAARPGWDALSAIREGRVLEMDDDIASRWGPRIVEYFAVVAQAVSQITGAG